MSDPDVAYKAGSLSGYTMQVRIAISAKHMDLREDYNLS